MTTENPQRRAHSLRWLARLDGEEPPAERQSFEQWVSDPANAAAFAEAQELWRELRNISGRADVQRLSAQVLAETAVRPRRFAGHRAGWALAAGAAFCVFAAAVFFVGRHYVSVQRYVTGAEQRSTVMLDDGSQVILNVGTQLNVRFGAGRRRLELKKGEAVFTVAEDALRPFVVAAGDGEVTALGTRFQVRNESKRVTVTLLEGRVAVDRAGQDRPVQLDPGGQVRFTAGKAELDRRTVDPEVVASWTTGRLTFRATPLAEALAEINRYTRTKIILDDASLAQTPVNGIFEMGNSASVVSALRIMLPVEVVSKGRGEIVLIAK